MENNEIRVRTWTEGEQVCRRGARHGHRDPAREPGASSSSPSSPPRRSAWARAWGWPSPRTSSRATAAPSRCESEVGEGTCFTIRLPACSTCVEAAVQPRPRQRGRRPVIRGRILIVDDEDGHPVRHGSHAAGARTVEASAAGPRPRASWRGTQAFDLVLCDMMMPEISGMDLHQWLAETHPRLARTVHLHHRRGLHPAGPGLPEGVDNLRLEKPIDVANFKKIVDDHIRRSKRLAPSAPRPG